MRQDLINSVKSRPVARNLNKTMKKNLKNLIKQPEEDTSVIYSANNKSLSKMISQHNMGII